MIGARFGLLSEHLLRTDDAKETQNNFAFSLDLGAVYLALALEDGICVASYVECKGSGHEEFKALIRTSELRDGEFYNGAKDTTATTRLACTRNLQPSRIFNSHHQRHQLLGTKSFLTGCLLVLFA